MLTQYHVILNALLAWLVGANSAEILAFALGAAIIDADHALYYVVARRSLNLKKMFLFFTKHYKAKSPHLYLFHTIEFQALALLLSYPYPLVFIFFLGFTSHMIQDTINYVVAYRSRHPWSRYFFFVNFLRDKFSSKR